MPPPAVANAAEEAKDPARHLPLGIVGSLGIATALYLLMALCIVLMVPYQQIDVSASFAAAFVTVRARSLSLTFG